MTESVMASSAHPGRTTAQQRPATVRDPKREKQELTLELARAVDAVEGVTRRESSVGDFVRTLWRTGSQRAGDAWSSAQSYAARSVQHLTQDDEQSPERDPEAQEQQGGAEAGGTEGIEVHWGGRLVSVTAALSAASSGPSAVEVGQAVGEAVNEVIRAHDLRPGQHQISIWDLD